CSPQFMTVVSTKKYNIARGLPIVHHQGYICEIPADHRFPMSKFTKVLDCLLKDQVITEKQVFTPEAASKDLVCCVHTEEYVNKFFSGKTTTEEQRRTGFQWSEGIVSRCRLETGGTVLATQIALERGLACSTAGGTHHAFPNYGSGFCLLNDLAVAAKLCMDSSVPKKKILIVDLDVHQGDGTAFIFGNEPNVFTFSVHCGKNFPFRKQQSDLDVSISEGVEDGEYMDIVQTYISWLLDSFRPDVVLYDAGVDPHKEDELGKLKLTDDGLFQRDHYVIDTVVSKGIPIATVIGGGYTRDIDKLASRHTIVHRAAAKVWQRRSL
uniref:Histone deacetylase 12 n=2 Tax=Latimeria chalumnae TaxID=7897 RepID=H3AMK7_LATCH